MAVSVFRLDSPTGLSVTLTSGGNLSANTTYYIRVAAIDVTLSSYITQSTYWHVRSDISNEISITTTSTEKSFDISWTAVSTSGRTNDVSYLVFVTPNPPGTTDRWSNSYIGRYTDNNDNYPSTDQTNISITDTSQFKPNKQHTFAYAYNTPYSLDKDLGEPHLIYTGSVGSLTWDTVISDIKTYLGSQYVWNDDYKSALKCYVQINDTSATGSLTITNRQIYFWRTWLRNRSSSFTMTVDQCVLEHNGWYGGCDLAYATITDTYFNFLTSYSDDSKIIKKKTERMYYALEKIPTFNGNIFRAGATWLRLSQGYSDSYVRYPIFKSKVHFNWYWFGSPIHVEDFRLENDAYIYIDGGNPQTFSNNKGANNLYFVRGLFDNPDSTKDFYTYARAYPNGWSWDDGWAWAQQYSIINFYDCTFLYGTNNTPRITLNDLGTYYPYTWAWNFKIWYSQKFKIVDDSGNPIQNVTVNIYDTNGNLQKTLTTDSNGETPDDEYILRDWIYYTPSDKQRHDVFYEPFTFEFIANGYKKYKIPNIYPQPNQYWTIRLTKMGIVVDQESSMVII